jgi:hypothetical protein
MQDAVRLGHRASMTSALYVQVAVERISGCWPTSEDLASNLAG